MLVERDKRGEHASRAPVLVRRFRIHATVMITAARTSAACIDHDGRRMALRMPLNACRCQQLAGDRLLSFTFICRFIRISVSNIHISGPYCSARADEVTPHPRPGARAGCPTTQQQVARQPRALRARLSFFRQHATQRIATWTVNR
ncbi:MULTISPECIES: hypothetical protein [Burkholderia]|uniref:hypothetical protein n=1 Tax=Burkholderia TaxID=32008 RepID=UPI0015C5E43F|nr:MULTISPECIES: hypothetical protein [Burkholderia]